MSHIKAEEAKLLKESNKNLIKVVKIKIKCLLYQNSIIL